MTTPERAVPPETVDDDPPVTTIMAAHLIAITPDTELTAALPLMASMDIRHLPVIEAGRCLGVVLEADLVRCLAQGPGLGGAAWLRVGEIARPVEPLPPTARRSDAAARMWASGSDVVLVADTDGLRGIVTATDILRSLARTVGTAADA
jgi:CBS domain-containing protein